MPQVIIIGTVALDSVKTPFGDKKDILGGSCTYGSYAASFFAKPGIVAVVGNDFPEEHVEFLKNKGINTDGLEIKGKTFRWTAEYEYDMNEAKTLATHLNVLEIFDPKLPEHYKDSKYVFLANIDPELQLKVLEQVINPKLVILDTMNLWIESKKDKLIEVIKKTDVLLLNDAEARQLFGTANLAVAAKKALELGPKYVIIKKGEHGALLFTITDHFNAPGYPLEVLRDPTGCGDSFAGGFIGYLAKHGVSFAKIKKAIVYGSVIASFNAEDFSLERMKKVTNEEIEARYKEFEKMREF